MRRWLAGLICLFQAVGWIPASAAETSNRVVAADRPAAISGKNIYVIPIRDDIMPPLTYTVRRGVKEAMEANADILVLDMDTHGGRVDVTEKIIGILDQFKGQTITYVNKKAFSAGALISFATKKIYMAPQSVIGAAAPIMMSPTGTGPEAMPDTIEVKATSALSALVRARAEKNGHNPEVAEAMVKKTKELIIDDKVINPKGQILTLTDNEAAKAYGEPAKPLLSSGTVESLDQLLKQLSAAEAKITRIQPTGAEKLGTWINAINTLLLIIGVIALYIEFKTPGFGLPGTVGIIAFSLYFLGGYIAGFSGAEWILVFFIGLILVIVELFFFPGTVAIGLVGMALIFLAVVMALVDIYPNTPIFPLPAPSKESLLDSIRVLGMSVLISMVAAILLARFLPNTALYGTLVSKGVSGERTIRSQEQRRATNLGQIGVTISQLRPGGKARFGELVLDVMSQGDLIPVGKQVKIIGYSGPEAIVEQVV